MELELKHLAPYLPYRLECFFEGDEFRLSSAKILMGLGEDVGIFDNDPFYFDKFKPILRPLSDLAKPITNGVGLFVPFDEIEIYNLAGVEYLISQIKNGFLEIIIYNMLLEWHFDVFGLIEKELAINVNDLK